MAIKLKTIYTLTKFISSLIFLSPCSWKGLMKIKSRFNWYCSLNEPFGWITWTSTRDRGEWRRVASMNCVRNELMNVILVWLPWLLNSYSQNHRLNEHGVCVSTLVFNDLHQLLFPFICISFSPIIHIVITLSGKK